MLAQCHLPRGGRFAEKRNVCRIHAKSSPLGRAAERSEAERVFFYREKYYVSEEYGPSGAGYEARLEGGLLTVTRLDVTPDLDVAKVYVSVMGREDGPKPAIEALNRAAGHVRTEVSKKMHIRKAPRFIFVEDDGAAYAAHINELLRTLNVNGDADTEASAPEETEE